MTRAWRAAFCGTFVATQGLAAAGSAAEPPAALAASTDSSTGQAEEPKPEAASAKPADVRGPADDLIAEAEVGYGVGLFSAIDGHDPKVPHGPMLHVGLGWAWTIRHNQSVGVEAFAEGTYDGDATSSIGAAFAGRYGGAGFVYGERAHLRIGLGYAHATMDGAGYSGIGVAFAAGWHVALGPRTGWKYPAFTFDVVPSWDFLGAGSQTLHRWNFGLLLGLAVL